MWEYDDFTKEDYLNDILSKVDFHPKTREYLQAELKSPVSSERYYELKLWFEHKLKEKQARERANIEYSLYF